jgi:hypothetical protein
LDRACSSCVGFALDVEQRCGRRAAVAALDKKKEPPAACKQVSAKKAKSADADDEDGDDDDDGDDEGVRFDLAGACAKLTGGVSYTYQQARQTAAGLPIIVNPNGTVSSGAFSNSVSPISGWRRGARPISASSRRLSRPSGRRRPTTARRTVQPVSPAGASGSAD